MHVSVFIAWMENKAKMWYVVFINGVLQKIPHIDGKEWLMEAVELVEVIGHIGNRTRKFSKLLLFEYCFIGILFLIIDY